MRIELERKKLVAAKSEDNVRIIELSCYMTLCGMDNAHKFLAFRNAMNTNYKASNFITAAHFARQVLDLEPTGIFNSKPEQITQHKKYFNAFTQKGTNAEKLDFNQNLNAELKEVNGYLCLGTLRPLQDNRIQTTVKCPLCGSISSKDESEKICQTCELCTLGEEVIGMNITVESNQ